MTTKPRPNPYGPEVRPEADGAPAIPLWIGGRAYLTLPRHGFHDLCTAGGAILRRVPRCGADAVEAAVASAQAALATDWPPGAWPPVASALAESLTRYAAHLSGLLGEESAGAVDGVAEVGALLAVLTPAGGETGGRQAGVSAVIASAGAPFAVPAAEILALLAGGAVVVARPSPHVPSALLALAELLTGAGLPAGRLNVVHGDDAAVAALCAHPQVDEIACAGGGEPVCEAAARLADKAGKPFRRLR